MEVIKQDGEKVPLTFDDHKYVNPKMLSESELPVIVLCDDLRGFVGWAIKAHTAGNYNHAFIIHKPDMMVSQDFSGFNEKKIDVYMTPGMMLKFWRIRNLTDTEKLAINTAVLWRLSQPWWRRGYDFLGTFVGQFLRIKWLQNPFAEFCSEQVDDDYIRSIPRARVMGIKKPSPSELNAIFVKHPQLMECIGYYWED